MFEIEFYEDKNGYSETEQRLSQILCKVLNRPPR